MAYFVAINEQGPAWAAGTPMREQVGWDEHVRFVNRLLTERVLLLAGPLPGAPVHRALLVLQASSEQGVRTKLAEDPWIRSGVLVSRSVEPWQLLASHDRLDPALAELAGA